MSVTDASPIWDRFLEVFEFLCRRNFSDSELDTREEEILKLLCDFEQNWPLTEQVMVFHLLLHCIQTARYWGSMTEYWM